jgi:hypothetical protein
MGKNLPEIKKAHGLYNLIQIIMVNILFSTICRSYEKNFTSI